MKIEEYLRNHTVISIGTTLAGYICCETIVDNPKELISVIRANNCYISEIRWWDHVEISSGSSIGYGGPRDPQNPDTHYFAETDICESFNPYTKDKDYNDYLGKIKRFYSNFALFPAFDIRPK